MLLALRYDAVILPCSKPVSSSGLQAPNFPLGNNAARYRCDRSTRSCNKTEALGRRVSITNKAGSRRR